MAERRERTRIQRATMPSAEEVSPAFAERLRAEQGGGMPLQQPVRASMETRLGHSFADVRVHADETAFGLARGMGANAFTLGSDIFLSERASQTGAADGDRLLAHELTHVVQQRGADQSGPLTLAAMDDPREREASANVEALSAGDVGSRDRGGPGAQAGVASVLIQREPDKAAGEVSALKAKQAATQKQVDALKSQQAATQHSVAVLQKQQQALQLDAEWRAKFSQKMSSYKQTVWRITGGIDAANKGFQDAQVAQAQTDQMWTQFFGLAVAVVFAGGFEFLASKGLGKVGVSSAKIDKAVEILENPANALVGGYVGGMRPTMKQVERAQAAQVPTVTGGGGGALAFLATQSEELERHAGNIEGAFVKRAQRMKSLTPEEWETFDVDAQAKDYEELFKELERAGKGIEDMRPPDEVAKIMEGHLWATWIKGERHTYFKFTQQQVDEGKMDERKLDYDSSLDNFGSDINERLIKLGIEGAAGTGLSTHWWERNADGWERAILNWARAYNRTVAAK